MGRKRRNSGVDRLSDLPDEILGHILSYLPTTKEAGRTAVLSTRWRYIFAHVHTLSFQDDWRSSLYYDVDDDLYTFYQESEERRSLNGDFFDRANAALLCRRRCSGLARNTSLRAFRVVIDYYDKIDWDQLMVYAWVCHALEQSRQELHLDLRLHTPQPCQRGDGRTKDMLRFYREQRGRDGWSFSFPRSLFNSAALQSLRLGHCHLAPPETILLPSLEVLYLTAVKNSWKTIHRIVSSCPRLADLTLESCPKMKRISVLDKRLRRLALRCCHRVQSVSLDVSQLRFLNYRGAVPMESLFTFHGSHRIIPSCTIDFCGPNRSSEDELAGFGMLLENFVQAKHLHLNSSRLGCSTESKFINCFPASSCLHKLELTGCLDGHSITRVLQQTPNLEVLSLFLCHDIPSTIRIWSLSRMPQRCYVCSND